MWDRKEVKLQGKAAFKANYWRSVLAALLLTILSAVTSLSSGSSANKEDTDTTTNETLETFYNMTPDQQSQAAGVLTAFLAAGTVIFIIGLILKIFVFNPLQVGCYGFFRENAGGTPVDLGVLKTGFGRYGHTFITLLLRDVFLALWTCLFIIPGIVKTYSYRMVPFLLRDHPEMSATEVITASRRLMNGHKWKVFIFDLSYIGWFLLGCVTLGLVNVFWTEPYRQNANAAIYLSLIGENGEDPLPLADAVPLSRDIM